MQKESTVGGREGGWGVHTEPFCVCVWGGGGGQSRRTVLKGLKQSVRRMNGTDGERNENKMIGKGMPWG